MIIIDIKSGKATPATALQLAAYSLLNDFSVTFEAEGHIYRYNGQIVSSVTTILKAEGFIDTSWFDEWSRDKGSMVHLAIKYELAGELDTDTLDPEIMPYLWAFKKFMHESGFKVERSEVPGINTTYGYAGTPDLIGCFPKPTAARRFALELSKEGRYRLIPYTDQQDFAVFLAAVATYKWKLNHRR